MYFFILLTITVILPFIAKKIGQKTNIKVLNIFSILFFTHGIFFIIQCQNNTNYQYDIIDILSIVTFCYSLYHFVFQFYRYAKDKTLIYLAIFFTRAFVIFFYFCLLKSEETLGIAQIIGKNCVNNEIIIRGIDYNFGWMDGGTKFSLTKIQSNRIFEKYYAEVNCLTYYPINYAVKIEDDNLIINSQQRFDVSKKMGIDTFHIQR